MKFYITFEEKQRITKGQINSDTVELKNDILECP